MTVLTLKMQESSAKAVSEIIAKFNLLKEDKVFAL